MDDNWLRISRSRERDAYYQAGHAVIAILESLDVVRLFMEDDGSSWIDVRYPDLGRPRLSRSVRARSDAKSVIRALLAGPAAQMRYSFGTCNAGHALPDFDLGACYMVDSEAVWRAISIAGGISKDSPSLISSQWRRASREIQRSETWVAIGAVANALLINGELAGCEVRDLARLVVDPKPGC